MTVPHNFDAPDGLTRRQSLKLFGMMLAGAAVPAITGCAVTGSANATPTSDWPKVKIAPVTAAGYGQDPNLIVPPSSPWPKTLTQPQLATVSRLSDILIPAESNQPGALQIGAPDVIDEWVSAPYKQQQQDRDDILRLLIWLDEESSRQFNQPFVTLNETQQLALIDTIAFGTENTEARLKKPAAVFDRFRSLVLAAYYCSAQGTREIGYLGNVAIAGEYPGPTPEAKEHLNGILDDLGLSDYAYRA